MYILNDPLFDEFHKRTAQHVQLSTILPGSYALILSMNFHTALIVEVAEISALFVSGVIIRPQYDDAISAHHFSRDPKTLALPLDAELFKHLVALRDGAQEAAEQQANKKPE